MKPVVALVGRPNVGKSTLFNRLTHSRAALVADEPGLTRDRQYGDGKLGDRPYYVIDTGGLIASLQAPSPRTAGVNLPGQILEQTRLAVAEADAVILLVDARAGINAVDHQIASDLRRTGKPLWLAINKAEGMDPDLAAAEFHALGLGPARVISSAHGEGISTLMEQVLATLPVVPDEPVAEEAPQIAVIGRPNAGKSTLVNSMLGEVRLVVSEEAGTTRDSIRVPLEYHGQRYVLIDTAGVRRRTRVESVTEKYSALKTLQAVDEANVVLLMVDAQAGVSEQDATLAGYVLERGRSLVLVVNKWDLLDQAARDWAKRELDRKLSFLEFARVHYICALEGTGVAKLFASIDAAYASARRTLTTSKLNRVLAAAIQKSPPPLVRGRRARLKFAHQEGKNPPTVVIHGNQVASLSKSYLRYLAGAFRAAFQLTGTPVRIECRQGENPYQDKRASDRRPKKRRP